jgi:hypothetical protein
VRPWIGWPRPHTFKEGIALRTVVSLLVTCSLLVLPAAAGAAKADSKPAPSAPVTSRLASVKINGPAGTLGGATATCPKGTTAVSGGFNTSPATSQSALSTYQSTRVGARSWQVLVVITTSLANAKENLTVYAYCRPGATLKRRSVTTALPLLNNDFAAATVSAACPKGTNVISGGYSIPPPTQTTAGFVHQSSRKNARTWSTTVTAGTGVATPSLLITTTAYCEKADAPDIRKATANVTGGQPAATSVKTSKCTQMISGGFRSPSVIATPAPSTIPVITESRRLGTAGPWKVSALFGGTASTTLTSSAYCA